MKETIYEALKSMTFEDVVLMVLENNNIGEIKGKESREVYYTAKQLIAMYPNILSKYKLDKYIKYDNFPVIKEGKERFFPQRDVEKWLEDKKNQAIFLGV